MTAPITWTPYAEGAVGWVGDTRQWTVIARERRWVLIDPDGVASLWDTVEEAKAAAEAREAER